jgi:hypothetical protein
MDPAVNQFCEALAKVQVQKAKAVALLHELEASYAGRKVEGRVGGWRQDPLAWAATVQTDRPSPGSPKEFVPEPPLSS